MLLVSVCLSHLKAVEICGIGSLTDKGLIRLHPSGNSSDNYVAGIHAMANWNKITPLKVNIMVSSARLGRLPNRINLIKCGMKNISMFYPFCNEHEETEFHIFFSLQNCFGGAWRAALLDVVVDMVESSIGTLGCVIYPRLEPRHCVR